jgi:hypothetical protein
MQSFSERRRLIALGAAMIGTAGIGGWLLSGRPEDADASGTVRVVPAGHPPPGPAQAPSVPHPPAPSVMVAGDPFTVDQAIEDQLARMTARDATESARRMQERQQQAEPSGPIGDGVSSEASGWLR